MGVRRRLKTLEEAKKVCYHITEAGFKIEVYALNPVDESGNIAFGWFKCVQFDGAVMPVGFSGVGKYKPIVNVDGEKMNVCNCDEYEVYVVNQ